MCRFELFVDVMIGWSYLMEKRELVQCLAVVGTRIGIIVEVPGSYCFGWEMLEIV